MLGQKLTDLESDAFQLKLRNYYLEKRLNASLSERTSNESRVLELLDEEDEPELRRRRRVDRWSQKSAEETFHYETLRREKAALEHENASLKASMAALKAENAALKTEMAVLKEENEKKDAELRSELTTAKKESEDVLELLADQITAVATENDALKKRIRDQDLVDQRTDDILKNTHTLLSRRAKLLTNDIHRSFDFLDDDHRVQECIDIGTHASRRRLPK